MRVAQVVQAVRPLAAAEDEEVAADAAVRRPLALQRLRFPRFPMPGRPAPAGNLLRAGNLLPVRNLLPEAEVRLPLKLARRPAAEAVLAVVEVVRVVAALRRVVAVVVLLAADVVLVAALPLRFQAWRSSTCC